MPNLKTNTKLRPDSSGIDVDVVCLGFEYVQYSLCFFQNLLPQILKATSDIIVGPKCHNLTFFIRFGIGIVISRLPLFDPIPYENIL